MKNEAEARKIQLTLEAEGIWWFHETSHNNTYSYTHTKTSSLTSKYTNKPSLLLSFLPPFLYCLLSCYPFSLTFSKVRRLSLCHLWPSTKSHPNSPIPIPTYPSFPRWGGCDWATSNCTSESNQHHRWGSARLPSSSFTTFIHSLPPSFPNTVIPYNLHSFPTTFIHYNRNPNAITSER